MTGTRVLLAVSVWLAASIVLGASGIPATWRPPIPQLVILVLAATTITVTLSTRSLRAWVTTVDVRALVLIHLSRLIAGAYFLVLYRRGELPYLFAVPGGIGDMVVALLAVTVLIAPRPAWVLAWNVIGLVDILMVITAAIRSAAANPDSMNALLRLPLEVLPTWLVPLILATHVLIFVRLARKS
jgi:hypothetical protein